MLRTPNWNRTGIGHACLRSGTLAIVENSLICVEEAGPGLKDGIAVNEPPLLGLFGLLR